MKFLSIGLTLLAGPALAQASMHVQEEYRAVFSSGGESYLLAAEMLERLPGSGWTAEKDETLSSEQDTRDNAGLGSFVCGDLVARRLSGCLFGPADEALERVTRDRQDLYGPGGQPIAPDPASAILKQVVKDLAKAPERLDVAKTLFEKTEVTLVISQSVESGNGLPSPSSPCDVVSLTEGYRCVDDGKGFPRIEPVPGSDADEKRKESRRAWLEQTWIERCGSVDPAPGRFCAIDGQGKVVMGGVSLLDRDTALSPSFPLGDDNPCHRVLHDVESVCGPDGYGGYRIVKAEQLKEEEEKRRQQFWIQRCGAVGLAPGYRCILDAFMQPVIVPDAVSTQASAALGLKDTAVFSTIQETSDPTSDILYATRNNRVTVHYRRPAGLTAWKSLGVFGNLKTAWDIASFLNSEYKRPRSQEELFWERQYRAMTIHMMNLHLASLQPVPHGTDFITFDEVQAASRTTEAIRQTLLRERRIARQQGTKSEEDRKVFEMLPQTQQERQDRRQEALDRIRAIDPHFMPVFDLQTDYSPIVLEEFERTA